MIRILKESNRKDKAILTKKAKPVNLKKNR